MEFVSTYANKTILREYAERNPAEFDETYAVLKEALLNTTFWKKLEGITRIYE
jgi:hypothetical protein